MKLVLTGIFKISPIQGLDYETQSQCGRTNEKSEFAYLEGETVTFSVGGIVLGSAPAEEKLTPADLSIEVTGNVDKLMNRKITNMARLLLSLNPACNVEEKIIITDEIRNACYDFRKKVYLNQPEDSFTNDPVIAELMSVLGSKLVSPAAARNHLRRAICGIVKKTDVKVPTRDGAYVLADIYMPEKEGRYPVIISFGGYGKAFWVGKETNDEERELHAQLEDNYFRGLHKETDYISFHIASLAHGDPSPDIPGLPPKGSVFNPYVTHISERFERANTMDWVPDGYVVMTVDSRGLGNTPGEYLQFGRPEANDYYDAIEWAGTQEWSNGNVGIYGGSFYAMNGFNAMSLQPPHLKACIPLCGDMDPYRDYSFFGGMMNKFGFTPKCCAGEFKGIDLAEYPKTIEFDDPEIFNPESKVMMRNDPKTINIPYYTCISLEQAYIHTRGTSEIFINSTTPYGQKILDIMSEVGVHHWMYGKHVLARHKAFFDYWLKDQKNDIMEKDPVHMMIRTGNGGYYWQDEREWPIAGTEYRKLYLNAFGDMTAMQCISAEPQADGKVSYPADGENEIVFVTDPLEEDLVLAGYPMANLFVSSTSKDMKVLTYLYALDEENERVPYVMDLNPMTPLAKGGLKISHRKLDEEKTTEYRPYHTHLKEDYQPLVPGEVVEAQVEFLPMTAKIKKGWKLAFVVMANNEHGELIDLFDNYSAGAENTIYTGKSYPSYVQLPVIK
ncbi:MAG: CocE/NonD family hydrolase [Eubacterium sp.]|nr:CocE/NonD family hydrolase [Eubacterium sp.]